MDGGEAVESNEKERALAGTKKAQRIEAFVVLSSVRYKEGANQINTSGEKVSPLALRSVVAVILYPARVSSPVR